MRKHTEADSLSQLVNKAQGQADAARSILQAVTEVVTLGCCTAFGENELHSSLEGILELSIALKDSLDAIETAARSASAGHSRSGEL